MQRGRRKPGLCWNEDTLTLGRTLCTGFPGPFLLLYFEWLNMVAAVGQLLKDPDAGSHGLSLVGERGLPALCECGGSVPLTPMLLPLPSSTSDFHPSRCSERLGAVPIDGSPPAQPAPGVHPSILLDPQTCPLHCPLLCPPRMPGLSGSAGLRSLLPPLPTPWLGRQAPLLQLWQGHRLWLFLLFLPLASPSWSFLPSPPFFVLSDAHSPFCGLSLSHGPLPLQQRPPPPRPHPHYPAFQKPPGTPASVQRQREGGHSSLGPLVHSAGWGAGC